MKTHEKAVYRNDSLNMSTENWQLESQQVLAAQQGEPGAIEYLLTRNWAWLKALVAGIVRNRSDIDDVLQEISVKVIRKIGTLRQTDSFRPWLACLARREALRWLNQSARRGLSLDHEAAEEPLDQRELPIDEQLAQEEERTRVWEAINRLPQKYKEVLLLYHSGQSYKQIAEILDLALTTVQIRLVRARRMVADAVQQQSDRRTPHESAR
jgi:RNA polymerase sigma-70 factor (ECF subfamily)